MTSVRGSGVEETEGPGDTTRGLRWGAAFPTVQSEGAGLGSDWFAWERENKAPPSFDGNGFSVDFADDLRLLAGLGAQMVRLTPDWARIEPNEGKVDGAVIERYRNVLMAARAAGLDTMVALVDGTLPGWFAIDERGFRDRRARSLFWPRHVERVAEELGDLISAWVPILRPVSYPRGSFVTAMAPPALRSIQKFVETVQGSYVASVGAWNILRGAGAPVALGVEAAPVRVGEEGGERPTRLYEQLQWAWSTGLHDGELSLPRLPVLQMDAMRDAFDALAMTFDGGYRVGRDGRVERYPQDEELLATLHRLGENAADRPLWIAGHSASVGEPSADAEAAEAAVGALEAALVDGIDLRLWLWEPAIDGYEGSAGFDAHLGLFDRDRLPKPAAAVLNRWSERRVPSGSGTVPQLEAPADQAQLRPR